MPKRSADEADTADTSKKAKVDDGAAGAELQKDDEGCYYLDLGNKKRVSVSVFKGKPLVNIREFYTEKSGELRPGKKGITLNPAQWETLVHNVVSLDEKVKAAAACQTTGAGQDDDGEARKEKPAKTSGKAAAESKKGKKKPSKKKKEDPQSDDDESD